MGIAAVVGSTVASSAIGGIAQSSASSHAASAQRAAAANSIAAQQQMFNTANNNLQPYIQTGDLANSKVAQLEGLNGGNPSTIQSTLESLPGYQFQNYQGLKSVQNSATERGLGLSGASLKGAADYSTGLANQYYNNLLTGIQGTVNTGAGAAESLAGNATQTGANIGNTITDAGQATAKGILGQGAGIANAAGGLPNGLVTSQFLQNMQQNSAGKPSSQYTNINQDGSISGLFDQGQNWNAPVSLG